MRKIIFIRFHNLLRQFLKGAELLIWASLFSMFGACQNTPQKHQTTDQTTPTKQQQITDGFYRLLSEEPVKSPAKAGGNLFFYRKTLFK